MKISTQENLRIMEFWLALSANVLTYTLFKNNSTSVFISNLSLDIYFLDCILASYSELFTTEYKSIKKMYNELIVNTAKFYNENEINNPTSVFATYVYMYRMGLFSHDKKFYYNLDLKDFAKLNGVDVVRGAGVCRSIASMLTDIYNNMGYKSQDLAVNANPDSIDAVTGLNPINIERKVHGSSKIAARTIGNFRLLANHQITMVQDDNCNYIFDPTNDIFLIRQGKKLAMDQSGKHYMKIDNYTNISQRIYGLDNKAYSFITQSAILKKPTITREEYKTIYLKMLNFCMDNPLLFDNFYLQNKDLIDEIFFISDKQHSLLKRKVPILPIK